MPSRAAEFRKRAADALRDGRNARHASDRDTHFDAAASYKALALEEEWLRGDRQRSIARKNKQLGHGNKNRACRGRPGLISVYIFVKARRAFWSRNGWN
jgi:hypothetical protein